MTDIFLIILSSLAFYCCLFAVAKFVFSYKPRWTMIIPFLIFSVLLGFAAFHETEHVALATVSLMVIQFVFLKISFSNARIKPLIIAYIFLHSLYLIVTSVIAALNPVVYEHIDVYITVIYALLCSLTCVLKTRHTIQRVILWTPKFIMAICLVLLCVAAIIATIISGFDRAVYADVWLHFIQVLIPILMLIICAVVPVVFMITISNVQLKNLTAEYEQQIRAQAAHYKQLAEANYETRRFYHDFNNMRIALEQLYAQGEYEKAMEQLRQQVKQVNSHRPQFETGNGIADAILTDKQSKAEQHNTKLIFNGVVPVNSPEPTDLCVILGNTLDNAIEACEKLPENEEKSIHISSTCSSGFWFLTVRNPIGTPVIIDHGNVVTTKDNKTLHGFGLYSLKTVVQKYDGKVELSADNHSFTVQLELQLRQ